MIVSGIDNIRLIVGYTTLITLTALGTLRFFCTVTVCIWRRLWVLGGYLTMFSCNAKMEEKTAIALIHFDKQ